MVYESYPWKQDLQRRKKQLVRYNTSEQLEKNHDAAYTVIEKAIFYSAFIIRKLIDCGGKLSDEADNYALSVYIIQPRRPVDKLHRWPEEDSHDWNNEKGYYMSGKILCNSLIHSFLFFVRFNEDDYIDSFCVSSDFDRNTVLYRVPLGEWLKYIDYVVSDDIVGMTSHYDKKIGDYIYTRKERAKR